MQISSEKRKEILMKSFDVLKDDYDENNRYSYADIIGKMFKLDSDLAINMWIYLLKKYPHYIKTDAYSLTECVIEHAISAIGKPGIAEVVAFNDYLKRVVFEKSEYISSGCEYIVAHFLNTNQLFIANELLELFQNNKVKKQSLTNFLLDIVDEIEEDVVSDELYNFFLEWINKIDSEQGKATINVKLLNLF